MYPKPDRSNNTVNNYKTEEKPYIDIGWDEGFFSDARPYRAECWAEDGCTMLTFFFSTNGLETASQSQLVELLEKEGLIEFTSEESYVGAMPITDGSENDMWSVSIVVGDDDNLYVKDRVKLRPYS